MRLTEQEDRHRFIALGLTALAAFLRIKGLGHGSFWLDEVSSVQDASHPLFTIHRVVTGSPPLFFYLVHLVYQAAGPNDFWLRSLPAFFGILSVPAFYLVLIRAVKPATAFVSAGLLALLPFHILYSQELRMYTLLTLESLLATHFLIQACEQSNRSTWIYFAMASIAGLYTHYWFMFLTLSHALGLTWHMVQKRTLDRQGIVAFLAIGIAYLPWIPVALHQEQPAFGNLRSPSWNEAVDTFYALTGLRTTIGDVTLHVPASQIPFLAAVPFVLLCLGLLWKRPEQSYIVQFFFIGCALPLVFAFAESRWFKPVYLPSRYPLMAFPAFLLPAGSTLGIGRRGIRNIAGCLLIVWVGSCSFLLPTYYNHFEKSNWKEIGEWINREWRPGDAVWLGALGYGWITVDYYLSPNIPRLQDLITSSPKSRRAFVPFYGSMRPSSRFPLGPKLSQHWDVQEVAPFPLASVAVLDSKGR